MCVRADLFVGGKITDWPGFHKPVKGRSVIGCHTCETIQALDWTTDVIFAEMQLFFYEGESSVLT